MSTPCCAQVIPLHRPLLQAGLDRLLDALQPLRRIRAATRSEHPLLRRGHAVATLPRSARLWDDLRSALDRWLGGGRAADLADELPADLAADIGLCPGGRRPPGVQPHELDSARW